jgi:hypothetical protein
LPERKRGNADLSYDLSYATTPSGVEVITTDCLMCHASKLGDSLVIGLGNPNLDFAGDESTFGLPSFALELVRLTLNRDERAELARFEGIAKAASGWAKPDTIGMNPADMMFGVLACTGTRRRSNRRIHRIPRRASMSTSHSRTCRRGGISSVHSLASSTAPGLAVQRGLAQGQ